MRYIEDLESISEQSLATGQPPQAPASSLAAQLHQRYPEIAAGETQAIVDRAQEALLFVGLAGGDDDSERLLALIAERDIRLRLGIDVEQAHLDPQRHPRRDG